MMVANLEDFVVRELDRGPNARRLKPVTNDEGPGGHQRPKLNTIWADDIKLDLDKVGLVDGLLETTGLTVVYGESGSGKTFAVLDLACHVAAGLPWRGMRVEQGVVVYVAAESPGSVQRRLWAWKQRHGVVKLPVLVVRSSVDLLNGSVDALVDLIAEVRQQTGQKVALVVVDTLARAMTGNENAPEDMGKFVAACGRIREAAEGHVAIVHHSGKDTAKGARGHSSLRAATDCEMEVTRSGDDRTLTVRKSRDGEDGAAYGFKLETVELGTNPNGRIITTCVAAAVDPSVTSVTRVTQGPALGPNLKMVREALTAAIADKGRDAPAARDIPGRAKVVTVEEWRDYALRYLPQPEPKQKGQAFKRAMEWLVAHGLVRHVAGLVWLPTTTGHTGHTGHMTPDVTGCDRTESSGHTGHTVTHPFRGVTGVTVTDDGRGDEQETGFAPEPAPALEPKPYATAEREPEHGDYPSEAEVMQALRTRTVKVGKPATGFTVSPLRLGVEATKGRLEYSYEGPYAQHRRFVQLTMSDGKGRNCSTLQLGGGWPTWVVAVEGHEVPDDFPEEPTAFNAWLDDWLANSGARILYDYRREAEADGALDWVCGQRDGEGAGP